MALNRVALNLYTLTSSTMNTLNHELSGRQALRRHVLVDDWLQEIIGVEVSNPL